MNFQLSVEQQTIVDAVRKIVATHAGPDAARSTKYNGALDAALAEAGYLEASGLEAALICEQIARAAGLVSYGAQALLPVDAPGPVALALGDGPVRYGAQAKTLMIAEGATTRVRALEAGEAKPVASVFGYPLAEVPRDGGELLDVDIRSWWRVALAAELAGTMKAALDFTVDYVKERKQFGKAIGSFQALQHRLAEATVMVEASRLLTYEAAWKNAEPEAAAVAAAYSAAAAKRVFFEVHQQSGSIGFTREHDLHVWSMRLQTLRLEMNGVSAHRRAVAEARWL